MRRSAKRLRNMLEGADFRVIGQDVWCDAKDCVLFLELEVWSLPKIKKLIGPPTFSKKHSDEFTKKYKDKGRIWVEGKNLVTEVKRQFTDAEKFVEHSLGVKKNILLQKGIASHVAESLSKDFSLLTDRMIMKKADGSSGFAFFLSDYFKNKIL